MDYFYKRLIKCRDVLEIFRNSRLYFHEVLIALVDECTSTFRFLALSSGTFMTTFEEGASVSTFPASEWKHVQQFVSWSDIRVKDPSLNTTKSKSVMLLRRGLSRKN